jgi:hypothetical protein
VVAGGEHRQAVLPEAGLLHDAAALVGDHLPVAKVTPGGAVGGLHPAAGKRGLVEVVVLADGRVVEGEGPHWEAVELVSEDFQEIGLFKQRFCDLPWQAGQVDYYAASTASSGGEEVSVAGRGQRRGERALREGPGRRAGESRTCPWVRGD